MVGCLQRGNVGRTLRVEDSARRTPEWVVVGVECLGYRVLIILGDDCEDGNDKQTSD